jgi:hypothetical protein
LSHARLQLQAISRYLDSNGAPTSGPAHFKALPTNTPSPFVILRVPLNISFFISRPDNWSLEFGASLVLGPWALELLNFPL